MQVIAEAAGWLIWAFTVLPGARHDRDVACEHYSTAALNSANSTRRQRYSHRPSVTVSQLSSQLIQQSGKPVRLVRYPGWSCPGPMRHCCATLRPPPATRRSCGRCCLVGNRRVDRVRPVQRILEDTHHSTRRRKRPIPHRRLSPPLRLHIALRTAQSSPFKGFRYWASTPTVPHQSDTRPLDSYPNRTRTGKPNGKGSLFAED